MKLVLQAAAVSLVVVGSALFSAAAATAQPLDAATPTIVATPSTGLTDGQTVSVAVSGFAADTTLGVRECALPSANVIACAPQGSQVATDDTGAGSGSATVNQNFDGVDTQGNPVGPVDCTTVSGGCFLGAATSDGSAFASTPISFG